MNLNYETWIVVDTKYNSHSICRQFMGQTWTKKLAQSEADYFNWSYDEKERFQIKQVKISFEEIK